MAHGRLKFRAASLAFGALLLFVLFGASEASSPVGSIPVSSLVASTTNGQVLTTVSGLPAWAASGTGVTLAGDVTGPATSNTVVNIDGASVPAAGALTTGNGLYVTGASALSYSALNLGGGANFVSGALPLANLTHGTASQMLVTNAGATAPAWVTVSGDSTLSSSGAVVNTGLNLATVPAAGALTTGNVLQVSGSSALSYAPVNLAGGANFVTGTLPAGNLPSLAGDVTGAVGSTTVGKIQGNTVTSGALTKGNFFLATTTSNWAQTALSGDVSASATTPGLTTVLAVDGATVPAAGALTTGNGLYVTGASALSYSALNLGGGANFVTNTLPLGNGGTGLNTASGLTTGAVLAAASGTTLGYTNLQSLPSEVVTQGVFANGTNVEFFDGASTDCGTSASGVLCFAPVTTAPSALPSTGFDIWNSGARLNTTALGISFSSLETAAITITQTALASTTGATTAGVALTLTAQAGQAGTSGSNGAVGGNGASQGGPGGSSDTGVAGSGGLSSLSGGNGGAATSTGTAGAGGNARMNGGAGGVSTSGPGGNGGNVVLNPGAAGTGTNAPNPGLVIVDSFLGGPAIMQLSGAGVGLNLTANTITTTTGTVTATVAQAADVLQLLTPTLTGNLTVDMPNQTNSFWLFDISGLTFSTHTLILECGTGTTTVSLTALTTNDNIVLCRCNGSNGMNCNL
jgi:hypothetical protein